MSFLEYKDCPEEGDTVIVYLNFNLFYALELKAGETFQTKYGALRHSDVIGRPYGSRLAVKAGFVHCLRPTPELWTLSLPHRTQILYARDISLTVFQLDLRPGSVVVESGTGSGSMTHSLARAVAPHGKVYTFDFHKLRSELVQKEFSAHGLADVVECAHRDVCADGFGLTGVADAVFLDLPHPWLAIQHAIDALKDTGGRICSFSPCVEQVQKTCDQLNKLRCVEVTTLECLERPYEVKHVYVVKQGAASKERQRGAVDYFVTRTPPEAGESRGGADGDECEPMLGNGKEGTSGTQEDRNLEGEGAAAAATGAAASTMAEDDSGPIAEADESTETSIKGSTKRHRQEKPFLPGKTRLCAIPSVKIPGHTGYLTFATFLGRKSGSGTVQH